MEVPHPHRTEHAVQINGTTSPQVITLNVGGQKFVTTRSTLTEGSTFFASLLSADWKGGRWLKDGDLFIDADPEIFGHLLAFLGGFQPPVSWTRTEGFNLALYGALNEEARYFGVSKLEEWISSKQYLSCIRVTTSIEFKPLKNLSSSRGGSSIGDFEETIMPGQFESNGGEKRRQVNYRRTEFVAPDTL